MARITLRDVAHMPRPGTAIPGRFRFSPDGRLLTFLWSESGGFSRSLWAWDLAAGGKRELVRPPEDAPPISREEELRRERARMRETGVTHYEWARKAPVILVSIGRDVYRWPGMKLIARGAIDPKITPDGRTVVFTRGGELWAADQRGERRLTRGAEPGLSHGVAEYVAQEELGRSSGFWISPDGRRIAFQEVDERHIPVYPIVHQGKDRVEIEEHRYPFAGAENVRWRLGVVSIDGGSVEWLDVHRDAEYLARVDWSPDGRLFTQTLSRNQQRLELKADGRTVLVEEGDPWINLHKDLRFLPDGRFVWASERTGFKHLYLWDGGLRPLTSGNWPVDSVLGIANGWVYFAAGRESPVERKIFRVSLRGSIEAVSKGEGVFDAAVSPQGRIVQVHSNRRQPPRVTIDNTLLFESKVDLPAPDIETFRSRDGETLYAAIYRPERIPAPLIVQVYGGPHAQMVTDSWTLTVNLRAQYLASRGFVVAMFDNRGSARRGRAFEAAIARNLGEIEVRDQVDGVRWLQRRGLATDRVGIYGWSYGGYLTCLCMVKAPEVFRAGVAGAPVTSWDGYDTAYTERYMSTPQENPEGYRASSVMTHVRRLRGPLLLIHGMLDENVHFRHTARLVDALARENKPYELLLYPNERHMPRSEEGRLAMEARIAEFFERHLRR